MLNEIHTHLQTRKINYWRDKRGHEIDFVFPSKRNHSPIAINDFDPANLKIFRNYYPDTKNFVVTADVKMEHDRKFGEVLVNFVSLEGLIEKL